MAKTLLKWIQTSALIFCLQVTTTTQGLFNDFENSENNFRVILKYYIEQHKDCPIEREKQYFDTALAKAKLKNQEFIANKLLDELDDQITGDSKNYGFDYIILDGLAKSGPSDGTSEEFNLPPQLLELDSLKNQNKESRYEVNSEELLPRGNNLRHRSHNIGHDHYKLKHVRPNANNEPYFIQKLNEENSEDEESNEIYIDIPEHDLPERHTTTKKHTTTKRPHTSKRPPPTKRPPTIRPPTSRRPPRPPNKFFKYFIG